MKHVIYTDETGLVRRALVRDSDTREAGPLGIPAGPPDLDLLDWDALRLEVGRAMAEHALWTWDDVQRAPGGLTPLTNVLKRALLSLYRQVDREQHR
jgi:hypothetical protein